MPLLYALRDNLGLNDPKFGCGLAQCGAGRQDQRSDCVQSFEYWASLESKDKWLALPPGTPAEIVEVYRDAFVKLADDPDFLARAKAMAEDFTPTTWQDLQSWIKPMAETPTESIAFLSVMLHHRGVQAE